MPTAQEVNDAQVKLKTALGVFSTLDVDSLERADLGPLNFKAGMPLFRRIINLYRTLGECNLDELTLAKASELISAASSTVSALNAITEFSLETQPNNPQAVRDSIIQGFRDRWETEYGVITPVVAYAVRRGTDFDKLEREARGTLTELKETQRDIGVTISDVTGAMNAALLQVQDAAKEAGVSQHSLHFSEESETYRKRSFVWLVVAGVFAAMILSYVFLG